MYNLLVLCLFAQACFVSGYTWNPYYNYGSCNTNSDCRSGCCVFPDPRIGKRAIPSPYRPVRQGRCTRLGLNGDSCLVEASPLSDPFLGQCPCRSDLTCNGQGVFAIPQGEQGICGPKPNDNECRTNRDCKAGTCCVIPDLRRGKRQILSTKKGECKAIGKVDSMCFVNRTESNPHLDVCPCGSNLFCEADGGRIVPQGFTGLCKEKPQNKKCKTDRDCGAGTCCVVRDLRRGKRQISSLNEGECKPIGQTNSMCFAERVESNPHLDVCPCDSNLFCEADGGRIVPQGFTGECQPTPIPLGPFPVDGPGFPLGK